MDVITANALTSGAVVFRASGGRWTHQVNDAEVLGTPEASEAALAAANADAAANIVVEPAAIPVTLEDGAVVPVRLRERIRAKGPTTGNSLQADTHEKVADHVSV